MLVAQLYALVDLSAPTLSRGLITAQGIHGGKYGLRPNQFGSLINSIIPSTGRIDK